MAASDTRENVRNDKCVIYLGTYLPPQTRGVQRTEIRLIRSDFASKLRPPLFSRPNVTITANAHDLNLFDCLRMPLLVCYHNGVEKRTCTLVHNNTESIISLVCVCVPNVCIWSRLVDLTMLYVRERSK